LAETGKITACVSSLSFSTLYYILRKVNGHADALALLGKLKSLVRVSAVSEVEIQAALSSKFTDFNFSGSSAIGCGAGFMRER
jgi:hypothetical protein